MIRELLCAHCGRPFTARRTDARACSPRCQRALKRAQANGSIDWSHEAVALDLVSDGTLEPDDALKAFVAVIRASQTEHAA